MDSSDIVRGVSRRRLIGLPPARQVIIRGSPRHRPPWADTPSLVSDRRVAGATAAAARLGPSGRDWARRTRPPGSTAICVRARRDRETRMCSPSQIGGHFDHLLKLSKITHFSTHRAPRRGSRTRRGAGCRLIVSRSALSNTLSLDDGPEGRRGRVSLSGSGSTAQWAGRQLACAYPFNPPKSSSTQSSSPTIHASCPGGMWKASPGPNSCSLPSSIFNAIRPCTT